MNYPLISEYIEAIKAAEDNFEELKHLRPVLDEDGQPVMTSGNFAVVFKMKDEQTGKLHAVKCFLKDQEGRAEAYRLIAEEMEYVSSTFLTPIRYLYKELFVDSKACDETEFPVLLMDWVEGQTLDKYIREHIDDEYELALLAYQFSRLAMWLMPQPFAHGDLKPDNILVREDGTLVLVDYDGMYVPAMKGQKARELGSPDFRHPGRTEDDFDEHIDDFSLISILLSLKAISLQPELLEQYGAKDRLLFSERDYRDLSESQVMDAIKIMMQDIELATLYSLFILSSAQNNLSQMSFRLLNLKRPQVPTPEDINGYWRYIKRTGTLTDGYGVKYSTDKKFLVSAPSDIKEYTIEKGTKYITSNAFINCRELCSISLPDTLEVISNIAFLYCVRLSSIFIPKSVKEIGTGAFEGCFSLTTIVVDKDNMIYDSRNNCNAIIETFSNTLILGCSATVIPISITKIGKSAFNHCNALKSVIIPESVLEIDDYAFSECYYLEKIFIPKSVKKIGNKAFDRCQSLHSVTIANGLETIGSWSFAGCRALASISIPNSISKMGKDLFLYCEKLTTIYIPFGEMGKFEKLLPKYKDKLEEQVDDNNLSTEVTDEDLINAWIDEYGVKYSADRKRLLKAPKGIERYSIMEGTKIICDNAFIAEPFYDKILKTVTIPPTVSSIGKYSFAYNQALDSIVIPDSVLNLGGEAFYGCHGLASITLSKQLTKIEDNTFSMCWGLKSLQLPEGLIEIGKNAFSECHFSEITIPDTVASLGNNSFYHCGLLTSIVIPNNIAKIGDGVFEGCYNLSTIYVDKNNRLFDSREDSNAIIETKSNILLKGCSSTIIPQSVKKIGKFSFFSSIWLTTIVIPENVEEIANNAFEKCSNLMCINIYNPSIHINNNVFSGCDSLVCIYIPEGSKSYFERLLPDYSNILVELQKEWFVKDMRPFTSEEIDTVEDAEVVPSAEEIMDANRLGTGLSSILPTKISQYQYCVRFRYFGGGYSYIPLSNNSTLSIGDKVNISTAKLYTLSCEGEEDIYRVFE